MKKNVAGLGFYSEEKDISELLEQMKKNPKIYSKLLQTLSVLGNFSGLIEVYLHSTKKDEKESYTKLWFFDENDNIFVIYALSSIKSNLSVVERDRESEIEKYDFALAKNFNIDSDNIDYLRIHEEFGFKYGRLITDQQTFYSLFLGENVGFQIQIKYKDLEKRVILQDLLDQLNNLETKPNLQDFMNIFERLLAASKIEFSTVRVTAYKELKNIGNITFDGSRQVVINNSDNTRKDEDRVSSSQKKKTSASGNQRIQTPVKSVSPIIEDHELEDTIEESKTEKGGSDMPDNDRTLYLDKEGYEQYLMEIEEAKKRLRQQQSGANDAYNASVGDGWHDNFAFEEHSRQEKALLFQLQEKVSRLRDIVIVEKTVGTSESVIDIGDVVEVTLIFNGEDRDTQLFRLIAGTTPQHGEINEVTINSPLGKAIYLKSPGDEISYSVGDNKIVGIIGNKITLENSTDSNEIKPSK